MAASNSMRRVWMGVSVTIAALAFHPAWTGRTSWWVFGIALTVFLVFLLEPLVLTWEIRRRGDVLQITDEGVLRRLGRGNSEYVRWKDLREVTLVSTQGMNVAEDYFYVLAGTGNSGVLVGQNLAAKHDLLSHLAKLPGFDHRGIAMAMGATGNQRFLLWRARPIEGQSTVAGPRTLEHQAAPTRADDTPPTLH
jgi:hypothetical protein